MESTGVRDRIHVSNETAELLIASGKDSWLTKREDKVNAKGKGNLETWWLSVLQKKDEQASLNSNSAHYLTSDDEMDEKILADERKVWLLSAPKTGGLIRWNTEVLARLLKKIVASRVHRKSSQSSSPSLVLPSTEKRPIDEIVEIIPLPQNQVNNDFDPAKLLLDEEITFQLRDLVASIAALYHDNPFHSFEHASHVTMSVVKLLTRIIAPSDIDRGVDETNQEHFLHDHTYGIVCTRLIFAS